MKRIFLDTNFLLDLLAREGEFQDNALKALEIGRKKNLEFFISFLSLANYAYIIRKERKEKLFDNLRMCCNLFTVIPNEKVQIIKAIELDPVDFEDAIQYVSALSKKCDCIITRDQKGFANSTIPFFTPIDFIDKILTP